MFNLKSKYKRKLPFLIFVIILTHVVILSAQDFGTMIDSRDNHIYKTVKIGSQVWMAENLNYEISKGSWCYEMKTDNCEKFGRLYYCVTAFRHVLWTGIYLLI